MKKAIIQLPEIKLVGISTRTNNASEINPDTAKIGLMIQRFFSKKAQEKIIHRKHPGRIFSVYTNYENDLHGDYTYFIGEEVTSLNDINNELVALTIPADTYVKFTSDPGMMPEIIIEMWQNIWKMSPQELGGERAYVADFEIFSDQSFNQDNATADIYIGINTKK